MPRLPQFEVSPSEAAARLRPNAMGATAWEQAGRVAHSYSYQEMEDARASAGMVSRGIRMLGRPVEQWAHDAKQHADFQAQMNAAMLSAGDDMAWENKTQHLMDPYANPNFNPDEPESPTNQKMISPSPFSYEQRGQGLLQSYEQHREQLREKLASSIDNNEKGLHYFDMQTIEGMKRMQRHIMANQSKYATLGATNAIETSVNSLAAASADSPENLDANLASLDKQIGAINGMPGLSDVQEEEFHTKVRLAARKRIVEQSIVGAIAKYGQKGLEWARGVVESGKYAADIGEDQGKLLKFLNTSQKALLSDQETKLRLIDKEQVNAINNTVEGYLADPSKPLAGLYHEHVFQADPKTGFRARPDLADKEYKIIERFRNPKFDVSPVVSQTTLRSLIQRMNLPEGNPEAITSRQQIDDIYANSKNPTLSTTDYKTALTEFKSIHDTPLSNDLKSANAKFFDHFKYSIDTSMLGTQQGPLHFPGHKSALGQQNIQAAEHELRSLERQYIREGKDPNATLLNPNSPDYFGHRLSKYYTSVAEANKFDAQITQHYQQAVHSILSTYAPGSQTMTQPDTAPSGTPMEIASHYLGDNEVRDHATLTAFLNRASPHFLDPARTAWCARFMNSVLASAHIQGSGSDMALSFLHVGQPVGISDAKPGDIIVFHRGAPGSGLGHVGFIKAIKGNEVEVLGGNQGNSVSVEWRPLDRVAGIRRVTQASGWQPADGEPGIFGRYVSAPEGYHNIEGNAGPSIDVPIHSGLEHPATLADLSRYAPGTKFVIPSGPHKGWIGTVSAPQVPESE